MNQLSRSSIDSFLSMWHTFQGLNPDVRYEVQYSSYVNVTAEGFVILKRVVKTESFALQVIYCTGAAARAHFSTRTCTAVWCVT